MYGHIHVLSQLTVICLSNDTFVCPSVRQSQSTSGVDIDAEPVTIMHPDVDKAESLIRNAWNEVKLVAD